MWLKISLSFWAKLSQSYYISNYNECWVIFIQRSYGTDINITTFVFLADELFSKKFHLLVK